MDKINELDFARMGMILGAANIEQQTQFLKSFTNYCWTSGRMIANIKEVRDMLETRLDLSRDGAKKSSLREALICLNELLVEKYDEANK